MHTPSLFSDLKDAAQYWRVVHLLGFSTLRSRYARSRFGQAWISLSNAAFIFIISYIWSKIWNIAFATYFPFAGIGFLLFALMSQSINESCSILISDARVYMNEKRPFLLSLLALVYKNMIIFLHSLPLLFIIIVVSPTKPDFYPVYFIYWILMIVFVLSLGYAISLICARFRDLTQIITLIMQTAFLMTPVVWQIDILPLDLRKMVLILNPFASFIEILRAPLLGQSVSGLGLLSALCWTAFACVFALLMHRLLRRETIYWI